jgi:chromate transporter
MQGGGTGQADGEPALLTARGSADRFLDAFGAIYDRYQDVPAIRHLFAGLAAASAGPLIATALKMRAPLRTELLGIVTASVCFGEVAWLRLPLLPTMLVLAPLSIFVTWWRAA